MYVYVHNFLQKKVLGEIELLRTPLVEPIKKRVAGRRSARIEFMVLFLRQKI